MKRPRIGEAMNHDGPTPSDIDFLGSEFELVLQKLSAGSAALEAADAWPAEQLEIFAKAGVLGWVVPEEWGGSALSAEQLTRGYEHLAGACLPTTFIFTQRNGACQRILLAQHEELKAELLPALCRGEIFATVGISHLTTSRQHLKRPAVAVEVTKDEYIFNGSVPWVTGAKHADFIVTGGVCADGRQVLAALPTHLPGVTCGEPARLMALNATQTGPVTLDQVAVPERNIIAGPVENVMKQGGGGAGSLTTSALALGAARGAITQLQVEADRRENLVGIQQSLAAERDAICADMYATMRGETAGRPELTSETIRQRANSLVLRATQAYLAASKGAGFVAGHPAERSVREAMFFLVWSCPQPVLDAVLREFACLVEG